VIRDEEQQEMAGAGEKGIQAAGFIVLSHSLKRPQLVRRFGMGTNVKHRRRLGRSS
jgi:hypothetical protein